MMNLVILGSGTGMPLSYRASPSLLLAADSRPTLFDIGPGTLRQLSRLGIGHDRIGLIFITHLHPDHTADLIHFLFATRSPQVLDKRDPFIIVGPQGFSDFLESLQKAYGTCLNVPSSIMGIRELDTQKPEERKYHGFEIQSQPLKHTAQSLAYRVRDPSGKSFVYSGDTGFCTEIIEFARACDLLILEASFPEGEEVDGHLTPSLAGRIANLAEVPKLVLLHFYPEVLATDMARECRRAYKGELILGRDLLHLSV